MKASKTLTFAIIAAVALSSSASAAQEDEMTVIDAARTTLVAKGAYIPHVRLVDDECARYGEGCAFDDWIALSPGVRSQLRVIGKMAGTSPRKRRAWRRYCDRMGFDCLWPIQVVVHELGHTARFAIHAHRGTAWSGYEFEEAIASALARDETCAVERRLFGTTIRDDSGQWACRNLGDPYSSWTNSFIADSYDAAGRSGALWWRFQFFTLDARG